MLYQREFQIMRNLPSIISVVLATRRRRTVNIPPIVTRIVRYLTWSLGSAIRLSMGRDTRWSLVASFCFLHFVCTVITTLRSARIW